MKILFLIVNFTIYVTCVQSFCDCGLEGIRSRIYKGKVTQTHKFPWIAHLSTDYYQCGGTLVDNQHIVTAAHCIFDSNGKFYQPANVQVYLGILDKYRDIRTSLAVERYIYDGHYAPSSPLHYDIAILRLKEPVQFSATVYPICIPSSDDQIYRRLTVAGWGDTDPSKTGSAVLREVDVDFIPKSTCYEMQYNYWIRKSNFQQYYRFNLPPIHENHICALNTLTSGAPCIGDSGGPLMFKDPQNGRWYLIGVVSGVASSTRDFCGVDLGVPGLFTSISKYRSMILQSTYGVCMRPY
uniref:Peptidase S1 domain-containing protein n=1 Tax=Tetranychus urticae TaxID=32264 RepID=T1KFU8_TETUR